MTPRASPDALAGRRRPPRRRGRLHLAGVAVTFALLALATERSFDDAPAPPAPTAQRLRALLPVTRRSADPLDAIGR